MVKELTVDLLDVIKARRSTRMFAKKVPPKKIIQECLEAATWAPNPSNQQPWEFVVLKGKSLATLSEVMAEVFPQKMKELDPYRGIPASCEERKDETFKQIFSAAKDAGLDAQDLFKKNCSFYDAPLAVKFADELLKEGVYVIGFVYPVVPKGKARIRVQLSAAHSTEQIDKAVTAFIKVGKKLNIIP